MPHHFHGMRSNISLECTQDKHDADYIIDRVFLNLPYGFYKPDTDVTWPCKYFLLLQYKHGAVCLSMYMVVIMVVQFSKRHSQIIDKVQIKGRGLVIDKVDSSCNQPSPSAESA